MTRRRRWRRGGLGKRYDKLVALRGVDVVIWRGAIYGVLGPSAAGKTTLVKLIGLVTAASEGTLKLPGEAVSGRPARLRDRIGYMPQSASLYEELSARFNIEFFARGATRERIDRLLEMLELAQRADDPVHAFSGGMKATRVARVRAGPRSRAAAARRAHRGH